MWEDQEEEEEEEDGSAGQLLPDILATSKYGEQCERRTAVAHWYQEWDASTRGEAGPQGRHSGLYRSRLSVW